MNDRFEHLRPAIEAAVAGDPGPLDEEINNLATAQSLLVMFQDALLKRIPPQEKATPQPPRSTPAQSPFLGAARPAATIPATSKATPVNGAAKTKKGGQADPDRNRLLAQYIKAHGPQAPKELARLVNISVTGMYDWVSRNTDLFEREFGKVQLTAKGWQLANGELDNAVPNRQPDKEYDPMGRH